MRSIIGHRFHLNYLHDVTIPADIFVEDKREQPPWNQPRNIHVVPQTAQLRGIANC